MESKMINDEQLEKVTGGENTGDRKSGKVYINSPVPAFIPSGYYDCAAIEKLAIQYAPIKNIVASMISSYPDIINAIKSQFEYEKKDMSTNVKEFLGIN